MVTFMYSPDLASLLLLSCVLDRWRAGSNRSCCLLARGLELWAVWDVGYKVLKVKVRVIRLWFLTVL